MNQLSKNVQQTMSSREIAELTGSRHDAVRKSAERLAADQILTSPLATFDYEHRGNTYQEYRFNKRDSLVLVARLSPEFTAAVVDRWQELEAGINHEIPTTLSGALRLAADQAEQIEHQQQLIEQARPAVDYVERYVSADSGDKGFRQVAKLLKAKEPRLREFLESQKIMYRLGGEWMPYQNHVDAGRFVVKTGVAENEHAYNTAKFTPKGVNWIAGLWAQHQLEVAA